MTRRTWLLVFVAALALPAVVQALPSSGIGPGTPLVIHMAGGIYGCTGGFVWQAGSAIYLSTAGHCLVPEGRTGTGYSGADWNSANTDVYACVSDCALGAQTGFVAGTLVYLGHPTYARQTDTSGDVAANDFGLILVPASLVGIVRPGLPFCGGPDGAADVRPGDPICVESQQGPRAGLGLGTTGRSWRGVAPVESGGSGSAVVLLGEPHRAIGLLAVVAPEAGGPTVVQMQDMAQRDAGLWISLST